MNFVSNTYIIAYKFRNHSFVTLFLILLLSIHLVGCSEKVLLPSTEQLIEFEKAGPVRPTVDMNRLVRAKIGGGSYRVMTGDVLEVSIPAVLQVSTAELLESPYQVTPLMCRIADNGTIKLPIVGEIDVEGKSLSEIELAIIDAYYPKYSVNVPPIFVRVIEYNTFKVSIVGAVRKSGVYSLPIDQMSLVSLIMKAEGIVDEGAAIIRIIHNDQFAQNVPQETDQIDIHLKSIIDAIDNGNSVASYKAANTAGRAKESEPLVLPIKGLNIPFADVALRDGDIVEVERLEQPLFSVIGLVNKPGNFSYPPDVKFNLMQAVAFAGGFNEAAEPRYATVYRQKSDNTIVNATFKVIDGSKLTEASNVLIKPGDIVAVEHTSRTRTNLFIHNMFRINMGLYVPINDAFD